MASSKNQPPLARPALDPAQLEARSSAAYPEPFRSRVLPREKRALGDALGLTKVGINLTTLLPGKESSMRHFHTREDELVFDQQSRSARRGGVCRRRPRLPQRPRRQGRLHAQGRHFVLATN